MPQASQSSNFPLTANVMPLSKIMILRYILSLILLVSTTGCSNIYSRLTYDFEELSSSINILYEIGAEDLAMYTDENLEDIFSEVEAQQYLQFKAPEEIKVILFNDKGRYSNYSSASMRTRGSATTNDIYISPIIRERIETFRSVLKHELSHIHIRQYIGTWSYVRDIPGWFLEGLAVESSGGAGAENVSTEEAIKFIKAGKYFSPRTEGGFLRHNSAHDYGLKPHMYYRQAGLFVRYLKELDNDSFKRSYIGLTKGESFGIVWKMHYGKNLEELWEGFIEKLQA